jgi:hypothetical protein
MKEKHIKAGEPPHVEGADLRYELIGEFREPRAGEWYLSGAIPQAWRAPNALNTKYHILRPIPRLFAGILGGEGVSYADRYRERSGDYVHLGFLSFRTLKLDVEKDCPAKLRAQITEDAAKIQARKGQEYPVSSSGQWVTLGWGLPA